jgi:hypothetical protein
VRKGGHVVLSCDGGVAFHVIWRVVRCTAVACPDLEAVQAFRAAIVSIPDRSTTNHPLGTEINHPPWKRIDSRATNSRLTVGTGETPGARSIVGQRSYETLVRCRLGHGAGLLLVVATCPGEVCT